VVRVEHVADGFLGRILDGGNYVPGLLGEVGVVDQHEIVEDDPDVIAAAEGHLGVGGADRGIAEEDAGGDLAHLVELHRGDVLGGERAGVADQANGDEGEQGPAVHGESPGYQRGRCAPLYAPPGRAARGRFWLGFVGRVSFLDPPYEDLTAAVQL